MFRHRIILIGFFLLINQAVMGQEIYPKQFTTTIDTISFELTDHNNISIKGIVNEVDTVKLMLHTAANSVTLIKKTTHKLTSIKWNESDKVKSWGGESEARYSENNVLQIKGFKWDSVAIWENKHSGPTTDGKFGLNLFQGKVIEIDFDKKVLVLHKKLPAKIEQYEKLQLIKENGSLFIEGTSTVGAVAYKNKFLIHSGYAGTILYDDDFVETSKIGAQIKITAEKELKDSYGNVLKTKKGILSNFTVGTENFTEIPVGFFEGSIGRQKMSIIGGDLLKRFNLIIDSDKEYIYLKSNQLKNAPYKDV